MTRPLEKGHERWYFTFGVDSAYSMNFIEAHAPSRARAREMMVAAHGVKWGFQYSEEQFAGQAEKWELTRLGCLVDTPHPDHGPAFKYING